MNIYNGIYSWDGKRHGNREPIAWFPGAYHLQLFDLTEGKKDVVFLKPYLCIFTETGKGLSISVNPEKFAGHVCRDFSLDFERVLWVELIHGERQRYEIVVFHRSGAVGEHVFYRAQRRAPTEAERHLIAKQCESLKLSFSISADSENR